jgi:hypothetical protein
MIKSKRKKLVNYYLKKKTATPLGDDGGEMK